MHIVICSNRPLTIPDSTFDVESDRLTALVQETLDSFDKLVELEPDVVILSGYDHSDDISARLGTLAALIPRSAVIPVCTNPTPDLLLQLMQKGVQEVLPNDSPEALAGAISRVRARNRLAEKNSVNTGRRIAFVSAKGGDGASCVAANFSAALAAIPGTRVLLIDLALPFGDIEMFLTSRHSQYELGDFATEIERLDTSLLESMCLKLGDGFHFIPSPSTLDKLAVITPSHIVRLIDVAARSYDFVILDTGAGVDPVTLAILEKLDQLVIIATETVPSLRRTGQMLRVLETLNIRGDRISVVINRHSDKAVVTTGQFEKAVGKRVSRSLPDEPDVVSDSLLQGNPVMAIAPRSRFAAAVTEWAMERAGRPNSGRSLWHRLRIK